jgi:hypothetical protein
MAVQLKDETLQDILSLVEPDRSIRLREWVNEFDPEEGDSILLRPVRGSGMQIPSDGKSMSFGPRGKRIGRRRAISLLMEYGPDGQYIGVDRKTGMTAAKFATMSGEEKQKWDGTQFNFNENYLVHVPRGTEEVDETEETEDNG